MLVYYATPVDYYYSTGPLSISSIAAQPDIHTSSFYIHIHVCCFGISCETIPRLASCMLRCETCT